MRLRRDKRAPEFLKNSEKVILEPTQYKGKWREVFGNDHPIHVEFGCGMGAFIRELAKRNPNINYVAVERAETVLYKACRRAHEEDTPNNVYFLYTDVTDCLEIFGVEEVSRIYLNFSDPWPKKKHAAKRLTYRTFLAKYEMLLDKNGEIHFKTDNKLLFASSIEEFSLCKWQLKNVTLNLHNSGMTDNIMTEYEKKFSEQGFTINRLEAIPPKNIH
jgi:tRNA (guanine-N7-)-methyltransferase